MDRPDSFAAKFRAAAKWMTTPPQAYGVYLIALIVIFLASFYAGTMKPKHAPAPRSEIGVARIG